MFVTAVNDELFHSAKLLIRQNVLFGVFCLGDRDIVHNVAFVLPIVRGVDSDVFGVDEVVFSVDTDFERVSVGRCSVAHSVVYLFHAFNVSEIRGKSRDFFSYSSSIRRLQPHTASRPAFPLGRGCYSRPSSLRYRQRILTGSSLWHRQRR